MIPKHVPVTLGSPRFRSVEADGFQVTEAWFPPGLVLPPHSHGWNCVTVMLDGSFDLSIAGRTLACPPVSIFNEPAGERHSNRVDRAGAHVLVIQPDPLRNDLFSPCARFLREFRHFRHGTIASHARRLAWEMEHPDSLAPLAIEAAALDMMALAARLPADRDLRNGPPRWLRSVHDLLHERFLDNLRTAELARGAGVHPVHLARTFRARYGTTIGAYVRSLRLEWAAKLLATTHDPISDVALRAGFADQSHFSRAFKALLGSSPARYRRAMRG